jgi:hypothetical protein
MFVRIRRIASEALQLKSLRILRKFFGQVWEQKHSKRIKRSVTARRHMNNKFSHIGTVLFIAGCKDPANMMYKIPGVRQNSLQFQRALMQRVVMCDGSDGVSFTPFDAIMLSQVQFAARFCPTVQQLSALECSLSGVEASLMRGSNLNFGKHL